MLVILQPPTSSPGPALIALIAAAVTAGAAWLSQGSLAYTGFGTERIALLPVSVAAIGICLAAGALVFRAVRRGASAAPVLLLGLVGVPWLPLRLPPALLLWNGPLSILVWLAFAGAMASGFIVGIRAPHRPRLAAGLLAFVIGLVAWWQVSPQVPGGDEPHYLVIAQSLLKDGDVRIENNHRQRDYRSYFAGELPPDFRVRGRDRQIYSIHAPGVSAIVAPVFAVAGYHGAVVLLLVITALGSALAWHLAWTVTRREDAAWFGWAAVTFSASWIFHSFTIYPDGPGAVLLLTGAWALRRSDRETAEPDDRVAPWFWHGAALALLPWMHTRFAVLAAGVGALVLLRMARLPNAAAKAFAFLAIPAMSFIAWLAYFIAIYGTPDPSAPYGGEEGSLRFVPDGLAGLLFDQGFGLMAYAPVLIFAFIGIGVMAARRPWRRHALELLFVLIPYLIVVTYVAMWWGGRSAPARFFVPVLPWMAIPAAAAWTAMTRRTTRVTAAGALVCTAFASAVLVCAADGALAFNLRETRALWLEWLNGTVDLGRVLPLWRRESEVALFRGIAICGSAVVAGWLVLRAFEGRPLLRRRSHFVIAAGFTYAVAGSAAAAILWAAEGVPGHLTIPSQLEALRTLSQERQVLPLRLSRFGRLQRADVAAALRLAPDRATVPGGAGRNDRPLFVLPAIPAGDYRVRPIASAGADGWLMIGIGRDQFAIHTEPLDAAGAGLVVRFPVDVRALIVRSDEDARRHVRALEVQPLRLVLPEHRLTEAYARHAVRYAGTTTFFLDEESYPEPEAFWVGGGRSSEIVIQPDESHPAQVVLVRNGAAANTLRIETKGWHEEIRLGAGEERRVQLPLDHRRGATLIRLTTAAGFTPSEVDPNSRDNRFLGVWIRIGG
ncbi:MAG TPA: hypothetical protein VJ813_05405 [Vicinamibacterales bacterium]|nr:hypothetical protein [Vicinamibacterales bacterium]